MAIDYIKSIRTIDDFQSAFDEAFRENKAVSIRLENDIDGEGRYFDFKGGMITYGANGVQTILPPDIKVEYLETERCVISGSFCPIE